MVALEAELERLAAQCAESEASYQYLLTSARAVIAAADATLRRSVVGSPSGQSAAASAVRPAESAGWRA
jgi:hypothetical protein